MGNYEQLKTAIADVIKANGNQEITGNVLQNVLLAIISNLGANATFAGIATPATAPNAPDGKVFYLAATKGIYANFGGSVVDNEALIFKSTKNGWESQQTGLPIASAIVANETLQTLTLGKGDDGLIYIFLNGNALGNGYDFNSGEIIRPDVYGAVISDKTAISLASGSSGLLGVKLSRQPNVEQTITFTSNNEALSVSPSELHFNSSNWNTYQFVELSNANEDFTNIDATIVIKNSDPLLTESVVNVELQGLSFSDLVDMTIPQGAYTVTGEDFQTATISGEYLYVYVYSGSQTNIRVPKIITYNGGEYKTVLIGKTSGGSFYNNTSIEYVTIDDGVPAAERGTTVKVDWTYLFYGCTSLIGVKYLGDDIINLANTFYGCSSLRFFDGFERQVNVTSLFSAMQNCAMIELLPDLSGLTAVTSFQNFASGAVKLRRVIGWPSYTPSTGLSTAFYNCASLEEAVIQKGITNLYYAFAGCVNLRRVYCYAEEALESMSATFKNCSNVTIYCTADNAAYQSLLTEFGGNSNITIVVMGQSATPSVVVWGDSTSSPNTWWKEWPLRLQERLGNTFLVKNQAVSGEFTTSTSARQGGNSISVGAFSIPSDTSEVNVSLTSADGQTFKPSGVIFSGGGNFNPCEIAGVEGYLNGNVFRRKNVGESVEVEAGSIVTSLQDSKFNNPDVIMLIQIGDNAGWNADPNILLNQVRMMVSHFVSAGGTKYIISGPWSGQFMRSDVNIAHVRDFEALAASEFGAHWFSLRQYLIDYGLSENGLVASETDTERMDRGQVPGSLLGGGTPEEIVMYPSTSNDDTHPNSYGSNSMYLAYYNKGVELGYW